MSWWRPEARRARQTGAALINWGRAPTTETIVMPDSRRPEYHSPAAKHNLGAGGGGERSAGLTPARKNAEMDEDGALDAGHALAIQLA